MSSMSSRTTPTCTCCGERGLTVVCDKLVTSMEEAFKAHSRLPRSPLVGTERQRVVLEIKAQLKREYATRDLHARSAFSSVDDNVLWSSVVDGKHPSREQLARGKKC